jgi:hypothetical protein
MAQAQRFVKPLGQPLTGDQVGTEFWDMQFCGQEWSVHRAYHGTLT